MTITSHVDYSDLLYVLSCRRAIDRRLAEENAEIDRAEYRDITDREYAEWLVRVEA